MNYLRNSTLILVLIITGCQTAHDVTRDPAYLTDFHVGTTYVLLKPALVDNPHESSFFWGYHRFAIPVLTPEQLSEYEQHKKEWTAYEGMLTPGTHIRFLFIGYTKTPMVEGRVDAYGQVIDGPFTHKKICFAGLADVHGNKVSLNPSLLREE